MTENFRCECILKIIHNNKISDCEKLKYLIDYYDCNCRKKHKCDDSDNDNVYYKYLKCDRPTYFEGNDECKKWKCQYDTCKCNPTDCQYVEALIRMLLCKVKYCCCYCCKFRKCIES